MSQHCLGGRGDAKKKRPLLAGKHITWSQTIEVKIMPGEDVGKLLHVCACTMRPTTAANKSSPVNLYNKQNDPIN